MSQQTPPTVDVTEQVLASAKDPVVIIDTAVRRIPGSPYLAVHLSPHLWAYFNLDEAIALRAQLDAEITRLSGGFA